MSAGRTPANLFILEVINIIGFNMKNLSDLDDYLCNNWPKIKTHIFQRWGGLINKQEIKVNDYKDFLEQLKIANKWSDEQLVQEVGLFINNLNDIEVQIQKLYLVLNKRAELAHEQISSFKQKAKPRK